jgi:hypothetical protein
VKIFSASASNRLFATLQARCDFTVTRSSNY